MGHAWINISRALACLLPHTEFCTDYVRRPTTLQCSPGRATLRRTNVQEEDAGTLLFFSRAC